jgi:hypothetical protein
VKAFGSTLTIVPQSSKTGFCDDWDADRWDETIVRSSSSQENEEDNHHHHDKRLACLDDIMNDIEMSAVTRDPWQNFPTLKALLLDRVDWDVGKPMMRIDMDTCPSKQQQHSSKAHSSCRTKESIPIGPKDVQSGEVFTTFTNLWHEEGEPLTVKREQLRESFWEPKVPNILNRTWEYVYQTNKKRQCS